jgi:hypothetical protein
MHSSTGREGDRPPGLYADEPEGFGRGKMPVSMGYEGVRGSGLRAGEVLDDTWKSGTIELRKTNHAHERMRKREVTDDDIRDARTNPIHSKEIVTDGLGRKSQILIDKKATVCINPDTGKLITAWKTGTKTRKKYESGDYYVF